jgi:hypothetical protein
VEFQFSPTFFGTPTEFLSSELSSPLRRIFIGSHSLPPSQVASSVLHLLQLQPSSPSTLTLVAFQFPNPVTFIFPPLLLDGHGVLDAAAAR